MRKLIIISMVMMFSHAIVCGQISFVKTSDSQALELKSFENNTNVISFSLKGFNTETVITERGSALRISAENSSKMLKKGFPDLPKYSFSLIIPDIMNMEAQVTASEYTDYSNIEILPSKGNLYRNINPDDMPYEFGDVYENNQFFPGKLTALNTPYIIRDFRGQAVDIFPFQYNPVQKILRVYHKLEIKLVPKQGSQGQNIITRTKSEQGVVNEFDQIYSNRFLNYTAIGNTKYTPIEEHGSMLIISHGSFIPSMMPFVNWKNTIGIPTSIVDVASIGNNPTSIKNYIQAVYDTSDLAFVLLVGDGAQVSTMTINSYHSDNAYGYLSGNDSYSEVFIGRFSAENIAEVQTQVQRSIDYELSPTSQTNIFNKACGIGSQEGPGYNNLLDYEHIRLIRDTLLNYNYLNISEMYEGSQGGLDAAGDPTPSLIVDEVNEGLGLINYCGHGWDQGWGTSGFSNTEVNSLVNTDKLPFIWSVACVNGNFVGATCFAEAWLRATNNNQPTGAVAALMSTVNQSWNPPMAAQLEMNNLLTESFSNNIKRTFGGLSMNGCMKMNDEFGQGGTEMTDTWTIFGDPSLMVRTDNPDPLTVTHNSVEFLGSDNLMVLCPTEGAFVCLTINNQIIATGHILGGNVLLNFPPLSTIDTITVAVTAYNHIPYLGEVYIIPPSGPYVIYNSHTINDSTGNNNNLADFDETLFLNVSLKNVGINNADSVWAVLSTNSPYITVDNNQNLWGDFIPAQQLMVNNAFEITISDDIPNNYSNLMSLVVRDNDTNIWHSSFILSANAPDFIAGAIAFDDASGNSNNIIDPGENSIVSISTSNLGNAGINNITASISTASPYLTINNGTHSFASFPAGTTDNALFTITADPQTPNETEATIVYTLSAGAYSITKNFTFYIGLLPTFLMKDTTVYICDAYFYDSNGPDSEYSISENKTMTFFPNSSVPLNEAHLRVQFSEFDVEANEWAGGCWDELFIYNGPNTASQLIGSYCGEDLPPVITSTHPTGALTFKFASDDYVELEGWKAQFTCIISTSDEELTHIPELSVYPNPAEDIFSIEINIVSEQFEISIISAEGALAYSEKFEPTSVTTQKSFNTSEFASGIYFLNLKSTSYNIVKKIVVF
ncbi:MAG: C25 family cysteine peptidase [Bacteroidales bacterium]|nr:C25 family cysteine peptidase [Bacteroidales bacterium]